MYKLAQEQVHLNADLLRPGTTIRDFVDRCWTPPEKYTAQRYTMLVHGVGLVDEAPVLMHPKDFQAWGNDGVIEENMVLSAETYIGEVGGPDGVKLEQQYLITKSGPQCMSNVKFFDALEIT